MKSAAILLALFCLGACTEETVLVDGVKYRVDRANDIDERMPQNSDLEMVDGNLAEYAAHLCGETNMALESDKITRCELYVRQDQGSLLYGYAALATRPDGVSIATQTSAPSTSCFIHGALETDNEGTYQWIKLASTTDNFRASIEYNAWERSPDEWIVAAKARPSLENGETRQGHLGEWYFEKMGDNLRIHEGRWSYCSEDRVVDDVLTHVLTLTKA